MRRMNERCSHFCLQVVGQHYLRIWSYAMTKSLEFLKTKTAIFL